jgi:hypothetical protein
MTIAQKLLAFIRIRLCESKVTLVALVLASEVTAWVWSERARIALQAMAAGVPELLEWAQSPPSSRRSASRQQFKWQTIAAPLASAFLVGVVIGAFLVALLFVPRFAAWLTGLARWFPVL